MKNIATLALALALLGTGVASAHPGHAHPPAKPTKKVVHKTVQRPAPKPAHKMTPGMDPNMKM